MLLSWLCCGFCGCMLISTHDTFCCGSSKQDWSEQEQRPTTRQFCLWQGQELRWRAGFELSAVPLACPFVEVGFVTEYSPFYASTTEGVWRHYVFWLILCTMSRLVEE